VRGGEAAIVHAYYKETCPQGQAVFFLIQSRVNKKSISSAAA